MVEIAKQVWWAPSEDKPAVCEGGWAWGDPEEGTHRCAGACWALGRQISGDPHGAETPVWGHGRLLGAQALPTLIPTQAARPHQGSEECGCRKGWPVQRRPGVVLQLRARQGELVVEVSHLTELP